MIRVNGQSVSDVYINDNDVNEQIGNSVVLLQLYQGIIHMYFHNFFSTWNFWQLENVVQCVVFRSHAGIEPRCYSYRAEYGQSYSI